MKRRWKKFLAGVLSAALALNLAAPLALAGSSTMGAACGVTNVLLSPEWNGPVDSKKCIQGTVSYNRGLLTFDGDVTLDTTSDPYNSSLVEALSEKNLRLVANGKVTGSTNSDGFDGAKEIVKGEIRSHQYLLEQYVERNFGWRHGNNDCFRYRDHAEWFPDGHRLGKRSDRWQGEDHKCRMRHRQFHYHEPCSELVIHAQQYIGEQGHLTYNGGHLLLNVTTIGMDFGLSRLGIGKDVSRSWYRTDDDAGYTEIDTSVQEKLDSFFEVKETNHAYLELTDVDPDQQESETYDLWVAGTAGNGNQPERRAEQRHRVL